MSGGATASAGAPRRDPLRIVVWGIMAHAPFGGMVWQVLHHLAGLRRLGHDVWYVEDSDQMMMNLAVDDWVTTARDNAAFLGRYLDALGMRDRWVIRTPSKRECFGARGWRGLQQLYGEADLVVNLCGSHQLLPHHDRVRALLYLETDPGESQVARTTGALRGRGRRFADLDRYAAHATYATNLGAPDCLVPATDLDWIRTVPPVDVDAWATDAPPARDAFTTVMNWSTAESTVTWEGERWPWSKHAAVRALLPLASRTSAHLEVSLRGGADDTIRTELADAGWSVHEARTLDRAGAYRRYVRGSAAELSVAKAQYVVPRSGWVSDRTVCYLAAGRPAVVERTGIVGVPTGDGLLPFTGLDEAAAAVEDVLARPAHHAAAARALAREHFAAERVLADLLDAVAART